MATKDSVKKSYDAKDIQISSLTTDEADGLG